jgi:hypothetical protein
VELPLATWPSPTLRLDVYLFIYLLLLKDDIFSPVYKTSNSRMMSDMENEKRKQGISRGLICGNIAEYSCRAESNHKTSRISRCSGQDSKHISSEYESEALLLQSTCLGEARYFNSKLE